MYPDTLRSDREQFQSQSSEKVNLSNRVSGGGGYRKPLPDLPVLVCILARSCAFDR